MEALSLDGSWRLRSTRPREGERRGYHEKGAVGSGWIRARVPGDVHDDLRRARKAPDPLVGENARRLERLEGLDWWYVREFRVPPRLEGRPAELVLDGVDCDCDVYLNGRLAAESIDAHLPIRAKATKRLKPGKNLIAVRVDDGTRRGRTCDPDRYPGWRADYRMFLRKPQFTLKWDWAPRLSTCGIWRPARIEFHGAATVRDLSARVRLGKAGATVEVTAELESFGKGGSGALDLKLRLGKRTVGSAIKKLRFRRGRRTVRHLFRVRNPKLWWPAGYGEQPLYDLSARLSVGGGGGGGEECDSASRRIGLRTVELRRDRIAGSAGERTHVIHVNGVPIFCRGANWVPPDSLVGCITDGRYRELIDLAADSNFNMLRIWGGGIYEPDVFFDLCDERGIMVFMDFPLACAQYPGDDPAFRRLIRLEAEHHVRRLRSRASLVLWSGNNEIQQMLDGFRVRGAEVPDRTTVIFDKVLPSVLRRLDPTRPYQPGSPYYGDWANSSFEGDRHNWDVSLGDPDNPRCLDYNTYASDRGKFQSEWGMLSCSNAETIRRSLPKGKARPGSGAWEFHANLFDHGVPERRVREFVHPEPRKLSLEDYVRATQMFQAEGLAFGIECWRRGKFDCAGSLYWMFNDCWPATTGWTTFDYYLARKASYYAVKRAYAPVMISLAQRDGQVECWAVNDTLEKVRGTVESGLMRTDGRELSSFALDVELDPNSSARVFSLPIPSWVHRDSEFFHARLEGRRGRRKVSSDTVMLLDWFRYLHLEEPRIRTQTWHTSGGGARMSLTAENFCRMVELVLPAGVTCDDNFFDLYPGRKVTVRLAGPRAKISRVKVTAMNRLK